MKDGLYRVTTTYLCAGFVVNNGKVKVSSCAPVLRKKLKYWAGLAVFMGPDPCLR
jgi:hypothetical protein